MNSTLFILLKEARLLVQFNKMWKSDISLPNHKLIKSEIK